MHFKSDRSNMKKRLQYQKLKRLHSSLALLFILRESAFAFSPKYDLGFETDLSRGDVTPSAFPIVSMGMRAQSEDVPGSVSDEYEYRENALIRISPNHPKANELAIKDLYWGEKDQSYESPLRFTFGRRYIGWSTLDSMWGLGQFEPLNAWDKLRATPMGLTGVFAYTETQKFSFRFFLSYLTFPEITPNVVIENNQFASEHPQSIASTPQTYTLLNKPTPLGYEIVIPPVSSIIFRPSIAFMMETKKEIPVFGRFAYGYLPLNYFPIALQASLSIPLDQIVVQLHPRLLYHHVYNAELGYRFDDRISFGGNALTDVPSEESIPSDYTTTPLSTSYTWSPWIKYQTAHSKLLLTQIWTKGGLQADVGPYASANSSIFSSHVFYRNASQLAFSHTFNPDETNRLALHEYSVDGDWVSADLFYNLKQNTILFFGGDIVAALRSSSPDRGAEFLSDLRTLDRIRGGFQYVY